MALLRALAGATSVRWVQEDATTFADDLLMQRVFTCTQDLRHMLGTIDACFRILARLGLQVQHKKTQLIVAYKGRQAHQWWKANTATTSEGRFLLIPQPQSKALRLPIVSQLTYLGVVLSYADATTATVEHRLQVAEAQRARLLKVLHSRTLPLGKRVHQSICGLPVCVVPLYMDFISLTYSSATLRELPSRLSGIYVLLRAHMSQESSQALLARLHVEDPLQFLLRRSQNLLVRPETRVRPYDCQASHSQLVGAHN